MTKQALCDDLPAMFLTARLHETLRILSKRRNGATVQEIAEMKQQDRSHISTHLRDLRSRGAVEQVPFRQFGNLVQMKYRVSPLGKKMLAVKPVRAAVAYKLFFPVD